MDVAESKRRNLKVTTTQIFRASKEVVDDVDKYKYVYYERIEYLSRTHAYSLQRGIPAPLAAPKPKQIWMHRAKIVICEKKSIYVTTSHSIFVIVMLSIDILKM
jgi:hypothetical protein